MNELLIDRHRIMNHRQKDFQHMKDRILIIKSNLKDLFFKNKIRFDNAFSFINSFCVQRYINYQQYYLSIIFDLKVYLEAYLYK